MFLNAMTVSISQDKRASRFLLRFRAVDKNLKVHTGILTHSREVATPECQGSDSLRSATLQGLQHASTPLKLPESKIGKRKICKKVFNALVERIECFAADGAADEQLAGRELSGGALAGPSVRELYDTLVQKLPNLKVISMQSPFQIVWTQEC